MDEGRRDNSLEKATCAWKEKLKFFERYAEPRRAIQSPGFIHQESPVSKPGDEDVNMADAPALVQQQQQHDTASSKDDDNNGLLRAQFAPGFGRTENRVQIEGLLWSDVLRQHKFPYLASFQINPVPWQFGADRTGSAPDLPGRQQPQLREQRQTLPQPLQRRPKSLPGPYVDITPEPSPTTSFDKLHEVYMRGMADKDSLVARSAAREQAMPRQRPEIQYPLTFAGPSRPYDQMSFKQPHHGSNNNGTNRGRPTVQDSRRAYWASFKKGGSRYSGGDILRWRKMRNMVLRPHDMSDFKPGAEAPGFGFRDDAEVRDFEDGLTEVFDGMDWMAANEAKNKNKQKAGSEARKLDVYEGRVAAADTNTKTSGGAGDEETTPSWVKEILALPCPGAAAPSQPPPVDAEKLSALKSDMAPWEAMHAFLAIRRRDYPTGRAFLGACEALRQRCRAEWGAGLTASFAAAHLIRAVRSHAPAVADALRRAWLAGQVDFRAAAAVVAREDAYREERRTYGEMRIGDRSLAEWAGLRDGEEGHGRENDQDQDQGQEVQPEGGDTGKEKDGKKNDGKKGKRKENVRYTKHELTGPSEAGALALSDEQVLEFGFTQEGPDEFSYGA